jgi:hypothetical protein
MVFDFSKIKHIRNSEDMIFNVFVKYGINENTSLEFVKNYLDEFPIHDNKPVISATKIFKKETLIKVLGVLTEGKHYERTMEESMDRAETKKILSFHRGDLTGALKAIGKMEKKMSEFVYITHYGIVRLMEEDCKEFKTSDLKVLFYDILLLCAYEKNMKEDEADIVVY